MATTDGDFAQWLAQAHIHTERLTAEQLGLLRAAFQFRQRCGHDYYSSRTLSHFLLHCQSGLKVAQIARLVGISRPTASKQQGLSSKEAIQAAHHRMAGRAYGKLLPRYAGPIAQFLVTHPKATRYDALQFIQETFGQHISKVALHRFLKKYGLDRASRTAAATDSTTTTSTASATTATSVSADPQVLTAEETIIPGQPVPLPSPPFSWHTRSTPALSC
jgi:transposase